MKITPSTNGHLPFAFEGEALLAAIVESSDDAIISKDLNGIVRSWNRGAERIFGYTAQEMIGQSITVLAMPERVKEIPDILARIREGERVDHYETKRLTKDGRVLTISLTVSPVRNAAGQIVGASKIARDVTERNHLEQALDEGRRQLAAHERYQQAVLESMPECIKVLGPKGELLEMNKAGLRMVEADHAEQVIGSCVYPLVDEDYRDAFRSVNESVFHGGEGGTLEFAITGLKGRHRTFETRVVPLQNENNIVIGALSATRDITDWKRAQGALRASEARFRAAVSAVSSLIWTNDAQGQMVGEQPGWAGFTGQSYEEYRDYGWAKAVHPEDAHPTIEAWSQAVAERRMFVFEHRVRRHDGVYRLFSIRAVPVFNDAGEVSEWVGVHTDITDERRLFEAQKQARHTAELLNRVGPILAAELDTQALTQKVTDLATQLIGAQFGALFHNVLNEQAESYVLYTLSGVAREKFSEFPMPRSTAVFGQTFRGEGVVRSDDITRDSRYGHNAPYHGMPEGHLPVRSYLAVSVMSRTGEVLGGLIFGHAEPGQFTQQHEQIVVGIAAQAAIALDNARLFTESQRAREALTRMNTELRRANEDLEQFAYSASHDLQEPLRMVGVYSQLLQREYRGKLDKDAQEYLGFAIKGAKRMEMLVKDLLTYTQAVAMPASDLHPVNASTVLERALGHLEGSLQQASARVEREALPALYVQEVHLLQLFQNLIGNAVKYRSSAPPVIEVSAEFYQGLWRLCVRDNGIGINPEYAEQVFGIFKRLHTSDEYEGTGIGLAICQKIVERYGGRIWVESEGKGRGSSFCFTLPGEKSAA